MCELFYFFFNKSLNSTFELNFESNLWITALKFSFHSLIIGIHLFSEFFQFVVDSIVENLDISALHP